MLQYFSFRSVSSLFAAGLLCFAAIEGSAFATTPSKPGARASLAPADQYFGRAKMSIVGMHTAIVKLSARYHARDISDTDLVHDAKTVESALYRWHDKYPRDG
jgi:hypothetical protein